MFQYLDTSGDHLLDKQEFLSAASSWVEACPRIQDEDLADFTEWDADGSGYLTEGEFFCFCEALWQIIGERDFSSLEAKALAIVEAKSPSATKLPPIVQAVVEADEVPEPGSHNWAPLAKKAAEKLQAAMSNAGDKDGRKVLRKAINEARSAGVDRRLLDEAVELIRKVEVEGVVQRAMDSKNPKLLKAAILNVSGMRMECPLVQEAEALLRRLEASQGIADSIASQDPDILRVAIASAERAGIDVTDDTRQTEKVMRFRIQLGEVLQKKDEAQLIRLINQMESEKIQDNILAEAQEALPKLRREVEAKKRLGQAICTGTAKEMQEAVLEAQASGVSTIEIERARDVLRKEEARQGLVNAMRDPRRNSLYEALDNASELGVDMLEIDAAKKMINKLDASRDLSLALDNVGEHSIEALRGLVEEAKQHAVDSDPQGIAKVAKAEQVISELEKAQTQPPTVTREWTTYKM